MSVSKDVFSPSLMRASFTERHSLFELSPFAHGDSPCDPRLSNCTFFEIFCSCPCSEVLPPISSETIFALFPWMGIATILKERERGTKWVSMSISHLSDMVPYTSQVSRSYAVDIPGKSFYLYGSKTDNIHDSFPRHWKNTVCSQLVILAIRAKLMYHNIF